MKKRLLVIAAFCSAAILAACGGGGGDDTIKAASSDLSASLTASNSVAFKDQPFVFDGGVPDFGTTGTTTLTVTGDSGNAFSIEGDGSTATGDLAFGSCIFKVRASSFAPGSPLATGSTLTISNCGFTVTLQGTPATDQNFSRNAKLNLNGKASRAVVVVVRIDDAGNVTVNGRLAGSVTVKSVVTGS